MEDVDQETTKSCYRHLEASGSPLDHEQIDIAGFASGADCVRTENTGRQRRVGVYNAISSLDAILGKIDGIRKG
jgi:hypothetical protein